MPINCFNKTKFHLNRFVIQTANSLINPGLPLGEKKIVFESE